jgi:DNA repair exonuclease SbcCD ATPase subunit
MILFKKIRWKNFLSTGNTWTEVNLSRNASTLIIGDNGAGKSTILDALSFGLYGKPFRKINKSQLVNSINKKDAAVEVEFAVGTHQYRIYRSIKPNKMEIYQNGTMINQSADVRDYQDYLETHILKLNQKSFSQIVVLGSATFTPFMQLNASARREVIEDILDIGIFRIMNTLLKDEVTNNKTSIMDLKYQVDLLDQKIELTEDHNRKLQEVRKKEVDKLQLKVDEIDLSNHNIDIELEDLAKELSDVNAEVDDQAKVASKLKQLEKIRVQLNDKRKSISNDILFYEDHDNCPTCKQGIEHEFKQETIEGKRLKRTEIEQATVTLEDEYKKVSERLSVIQEKLQVISNLNTQISNCNVKRNVLLNDRKALIESINAPVPQGEEQSIKEIHESRKVATDELQSLLEHKEVLNVSSMIFKDSGIKSRIIKQYIPVINKLINKYLAQMEFFVQFELDENFNETIKSRFRDAFSYASFSEGEKMRIDLALLFTWRSVAKLRNSVSTNLLIMDEVFDGSLDATGTDEFLKILQGLTSDTNFFIISHKTDQLVEKFDHVLRFEKNKNFSRMAA